MTTASPLSILRLTKRSSGLACVCRKAFRRGTVPKVWRCAATIFTLRMRTATQLRLLSYQAKHAANFGATSEVRFVDLFQRGSIHRLCQLLDKHFSSVTERELVFRIRRWWSTTRAVLLLRRTSAFPRVAVELEDRADNTVRRLLSEISAP